MRFLKWLVGAVTDPVQGTMSSTRISGISLIVSGIVFAFKNPSQSASIAAFFGGGALSFFNRVKSDTP